jgi:hypothetical protein
LFFPFIDHVINEMERRFPTEMKDQMLGFYLIPKYVALTTPQIINSMFKAFLWTCSNARPQSLSDDIVARSQVFSRLRLENDRSQQTNVTGRMRSNLKTRLMLG